MAKKHSMFPVKNKGGLHRALHVPEDEPIPHEKLMQAVKSKNPKIRKMALYAINMQKRS